ncbi:MAG: thioredoxin [Micavibrio sp.]|nr:thioredoxin [Micavibrio sp.]|tara:strand:+ start:564 stop:884 length:321 start_codon:yes stop_codon:yes gene_type:complete
MSSIEVNDGNFKEEVLSADIPVLVDFWAPWCGPCKQLSPLIDEIASEFSGKVKVVKINIDESPNIPAEFGVRGIPTLMVFKGGELEETRVGGMPKGQLTEWVSGAL